MFGLHSRIARSNINERVSALIPQTQHIEIPRARCKNGQRAAAFDLSQRKQ